MAYFPQLTAGFGFKASLAATAMLVLQGCVQDVGINTAAVDATDTCSRHYTTISAARRTEVEAQMGSAAVGALAGAVLGAALSSGNDRGQGAIIGALAGGLSGYSYSYYQHKARTAQDAATLLGSVNRDARQESALVTRTGEAAVQLRNCRTQQVNRLAADIRSGKVDKAAGRRELTRIESRIAADNQVISATFNGIGKRVDSYVDASAAASQVTRASYLAGRDAGARRGRSATPAVGSVSASLSSKSTADTQMRGALEKRIAAVELLLG